MVEYSNPPRVELFNQFGGDKIFSTITNYENEDDEFGAPREKEVSTNTEARNDVPLMKLIVPDLHYDQALSPEFENPSKWIKSTEECKKMYQS